MNFFNRVAFFWICVIKCVFNTTLGAWLIFNSDFFSKWKTILFSLWHFEIQKKMLNVSKYEFQSNWKIFWIFYFYQIFRIFTFKKFSLLKIFRIFALKKYSEFLKKLFVVNTNEAIPRFMIKLISWLLQTLNVEKIYSN